MVLAWDDTQGAAGEQEDHPGISSTRGNKPNKSVRGASEVQDGEGVVQLGTGVDDKASVVAFCSPAAIKAGYQAGKLVQAIAAKIGGKGGGKPDFAMGGGKDPAQLPAALTLP